MTSNAAANGPQLPAHLTKVLNIQAEVNLSFLQPQFDSETLNFSSFLQVNTARDHHSTFYRVYPVHSSPHYYDEGHRKWDWGHEQRRHGHAESQVWRGCWRKQQRFWVSRSTYRERYYYPWKEQMSSSRYTTVSNKPKTEKVFSTRRFGPGGNRNYIGKY